MTERGKRSHAELRRLVESAVNEICKLPRPGLRFGVDEVKATGQPPTRLVVWATLYFLPEGSPFCCGEPGCHLWLFEDRLAAVEDHVRRAMRLRQSVSIDFGDRVDVNYAEGTEGLTGRRHALRQRNDVQP